MLLKCALLVAAAVISITQAQPSTGSNTGAGSTSGVPTTGSPVGSTSGAPVQPTQTVVAPAAPTTAAPLIQPTTAAPPTTTGVPPTQVPPTLPATGITTYLFCDFSRTTMTPQVLTNMINYYVNNMTTKSAFAAVQPVIFDTRGDVLNALTRLGMILFRQGFPALLFIADGAPVTIAINDVLKANASTSMITVVSLFTANPRVCDIGNNPSTVCMVPRDVMNVRAVIDVSVQLGWQAVAVTYSNNDYGLGVQGVLQSQLSLAASAPSVVSQGFIPSIPNATADMLFLKNLLQYQPIGILAFVSDSELLRLQAAAAALGKTAPNVFFLGSKEALSLIGTMNTNPLWASLLVSQYTTSANLLQLGLRVNGDGVDERGSFILSHLLDAMTLISQAQQTTASAIRGQTCLAANKCQSFTGDVLFDAASGQRGYVTYTLQRAFSVNSNPVLMIWTLSSPGAASVISAKASTAVIPASPLRAVTVCMTATPTCGSMSNLNALLYMFLLQNTQNTGTSIIPIPINTGTRGVVGLNSLIPMAQQCTILTGPGDLGVNMALTPVINSFGISQIDYQSGSTSFSNKQLYPYFSRTTTSDDFTVQALAEVCQYFDWERVLVITTQDLYGQGMQAAVQNAMDTKTILIEQFFLLPDTSNASLANALFYIQTFSISRIVLPLLAMDTNGAINFFNLIQTMNMTQTHIFLLGNDLCQAGASNPALRAMLPSSICAAPNYDANMFAQFQANFSNSSISQTTQQILFNAGFTGVYQCNVSSLSPYSAFALDAGQLILNVVAGAIRDGISLTSSAALLPRIRSTSVNGWTGTFQLNPTTGDRPYTSFALNVQTLGGGVVTFARWDTQAIPDFKGFSLSTPIVWLDNTTDIPASSIRSALFIAQSTVTANPGAIALSVLGFAGTIAIFVFCYRHYKMQKLIELSLDSNTIHIEDDHLKLNSKN